MSAAAQRRYRTLFQFKLATLLLLVTAIGIWSAFQVNRARRQRMAVDMVRRLGGSVMYDHQLSAAKRPRGPKWLRDVMGTEYWDQVLGIDLVDTEVANDDLQFLSGLCDLKTLNLAYTGVCDAGLKHLNRLSELETLSLRETNVTGKGLSHLGTLPNLRWLDLGLTEVSDGHLQQLRRYSSLTYVAVDGTDVTAAGVVELSRELPRLRIHRQAADFANWLKSIRHLGNVSQVSFRTSLELQAAIGKPDEIDGDSDQKWTYRTTYPTGQSACATVRVNRNPTDKRLRLLTPHFDSVRSLEEAIGYPTVIGGTNLESWRFDFGNDRVFVRVYHDNRTRGIFLLIPEGVDLNPHLPD